MQLMLLKFMLRCIRVRIERKMNERVRNDGCKPKKWQNQEWIPETLPLFHPSSSASEIFADFRICYVYFVSTRDKITNDELCGWECVSGAVHMVRMFLLLFLRRHDACEFSRLRWCVRCQWPNVWKKRAIRLFIACINVDACVWSSDSWRISCSNAE